MDQPKSNSRRQLIHAASSCRCPGGHWISSNCAQSTRCRTARPSDAAHGLPRAARRIRRHGRQPRGRRDQRGGRHHRPQDRADRRRQRQPADRVDQGPAPDRARQGRCDRRRDQLRVRPCDRAGRAAQQDRCSSTPAATPTSCAASRATATCSIPRRPTACTSTPRARRCCATALSRQEVVQPDRRLCVRPRPAASRQALHDSRTAASSPPTSWSPTDATDFSPYLLKIRNAKPDLVVSNLAGAQITNFMKQYMEFGLPFPVAGFGFDTAVAWGAGKGNVTGIWPLVWDPQVKTPSAQTLHRRLHQEVRQAAGEPGVGRLSVDQASCAGHERASRAPTPPRWPSTWRRARGSTC